MQFILDNKTKENIANILRQAGYFLLKKNPGELSFIKSLTRNRFPRFHLYLKEKTDNQFSANLHLDQKASIYNKQTAHSGEYEKDNPLLLTESARIKQFFNASDQPTNY